MKKKKVRVISGNILFLNNIYWSSLQDDGGADRDRTDDLHNAIVALFQLSYGPVIYIIKKVMRSVEIKWALCYLAGRR